jgi:hypothetical protein
MLIKSSENTLNSRGEMVRTAAKSQSKSQQYALEYCRLIVSQEIRHWNYLQVDSGFQLGGS